MREICSIKNKEIFELKKKCKVVQDKISRVVDSIPVGTYSLINDLKKEEEDKKEEKNDKPRSLQN
jgi:hypothetical protein